MTRALSKWSAGLFVALWAFGHLGLAVVLPGEALIVPYLVVLDLALVLTIITRAFIATDESSE